MATINFLYRSKKDRANLVLRLLYRYNDTDHVFGAKTKYEVSKEYWTKQHRLKRIKDIEITNKQNEVNNELNRIENHVLNAFNSVTPKSINKTWLKEQINEYYNPPKEKRHIPINLIDYIEFYIENRKHEVKPPTMRKMRVVKHKMERLQAYRNKPILIKDINEDFKKEFVEYSKLEGYAPGTMQRELVAIKTFCKNARLMGLETHLQLDNLRLDRVKTEKVYLTFDELEQIENINKHRLTETLENVRDWLIISCYTGQRVSDFLRFTSKQIRIEKGKSLLEFTQKKTGKIMTLPLHPKVLEVLAKRNGEFPRTISDQKYNIHVKEVCRLAGITNKITGSKKIETEPGSGKYRKETGTFEKWELVSSHIGRRSFATNFYSKIPTSLLISATGHSTERMFLEYIGKSNKDRAMELSNYF